jgi:tetratricopeptide (TPR) repeat protein
MRSKVLLLALVAVLYTPFLCAQGPVDQAQVASPIRQVEAPPASMSAADLEARGDSLRGEKAYLDSLDYYQAALKKKPNDPRLYNKCGMAEIGLRRFPEAKKSFERAIRADKTYSDAHNNLGVIHYIDKKYGKAVKEYDRAIKLSPDSASFYNNLGGAFFAQKKYEDATVAYQKALTLDPDVLERSSQTGVAAQMSSPDDRAKFSYVVAKLFAKQGNTDRSLEYLRRAMEEGYKGIDQVYKDDEFAGLRKDPRFTQLMASRPTAIPE